MVSNFDGVFLSCGSDVVQRITLLLLLGSLALILWLDFFFDTGQIPKIFLRGGRRGGVKNMRRTED